MAKAKLRDDLIVANNTIRHYLGELKRASSTLDDIRCALRVTGSTDFEVHSVPWWEAEIRRRTRGLVGKKLLEERHTTAVRLRDESGILIDRIRLLKKSLDLDDIRGLERRMGDIEQRVRALEARP